MVLMVENIGFRGNEYNARRQHKKMLGQGNTIEEEDDGYGSDKICWSFSTVESLNDSRNVTMDRSFGRALESGFFWGFPQAGPYISMRLVSGFASAEDSHSLR